MSVTNSNPTIFDMLLHNKIGILQHHALKNFTTPCRNLAQLRLDRVSVPSGIDVDISDGTQWRGTELTCTRFLCTF